MTFVAVVDYGMGNLHSIAKALQRADSSARVVVTAEPEQIRSAERVVFPGVGAIGDCMTALHRLGLEPILREVAADRPFLGICLGMQALLDESEESGGTRGLGIIPGRVVRFPAGLRDANGNTLKIPHMGWNRVAQPLAHPLWHGICPDSWFYFVHSYYAEPRNASCIAGLASYPEPFAAALASGSVFAVQFHPEKSQQDGLRLLANFLRWRP
ncbi:MAG: imidazole glycerol phosphate synthase subunit HisH [Methylotetracoccus sp.]